MILVAVPNLAVDWKARVGVSLLALAIGLTAALATDNIGLGGIVLSSFAIFIGGVRYWQERVVRAQASPGHASDSN